MAATTTGPSSGSGVLNPEADLRTRLEAQAAELGFARFGVAAAEPLTAEGERLGAWLRAGHHGTMGWLERTEAVRGDVRHPGMLPTARSVVVLVTPYERDATPLSSTGERIARYAQGRDYHTVLGKRLRKLCKTLRAEGHDVRASVDAMPVFERAWAERAGVGFIGKNCCLIVPGLGSHVFLSALVSSAVLPADTPMRQGCGSCRLCLDACPTKAFTGVRQLDARRCISYLTIETAGEMPAALEPDVGEWLFGCDACQDPCPYNQGRGAEHAAGDNPSAFARHSRWREMPPERWLSMDRPAFEEATEASPLRRPGAAGMARNAAVVLGNVGSRRHLPILAAAEQSHADPGVRRTAGRARERLSQRLERERER